MNILSFCMIYVYTNIYIQICKKESTFYNNKIKNIILCSYINSFNYNNKYLFIL